MKEQYTYFIEKSSELIRKLISGQGTAKERLLEWETEIFFVMAIRIPDDLKPKREKIINALNKTKALTRGDKIITTSFKRTLYNMKSKSAGKIIFEIYDLYNEVLMREN